MEEKGLKKAFIIVGILIVLLWALLVLAQYANISVNIGGAVYTLGDVFGYLFYVIIAIGVIGVIWLLAKPAKKKD
jgi:hypothetical protein